MLKSRSMRRRFSARSRLALSSIALRFLQTEFSDAKPFEMGDALRPTVRTLRVFSGEHALDFVWMRRR